MGGAWYPCRASLRRFMEVMSLDGQISLDDYLSVGWPAVLTAVDTIPSLVNKAWELMLSTPLTRIGLAAGLLSMGIAFLVLLRRSARR